ncbi:MerR family transcriptional regulator [Actinocatenispora sera]|uniref:MerR family transcriptional regulator n=2 Tax=Actinocatenispora sera TaxID=390989 RepID=A0A810KYX6_9ACTN|nr:MerR family transcriptional regulator [Actinocatenispora sera]
MINAGFPLPYRLGAATRHTGRMSSQVRTGGYTVGPAAALVGVSVKTLHHWDAIGLVRPSGRTPGGYRVYSPDDVARIHRVLVYRELGFPLAEIGSILDDPGTDPRDQLRRQRDELLSRRSRIDEMISAVDRMLDATRRGIRLSAEEQVEIFGTDWQPERVDEAEARWGDTPQWQQYAERAGALTAGDWRAVAASIEELTIDLAAACRSGVAAGSAEANGLAERHRTMMETYFDCTHSMHVCLGRMMATDAGYVEYYERFAPGLAGWLYDAICANAAAHGTDPATATWQ